MGESRPALCGGYCLLPHLGLCVLCPHCWKVLSSNRIGNKWFYDYWAGRTWCPKDCNITDTNILIHRCHNLGGQWAQRLRGLADRGWKCQGSHEKKFRLKSTLTHRPSPNSHEKDLFYFKMWDSSVTKAMLWVLHIFTAVLSAVGPLQTPFLSEETAIKVDASSS